MLNWLLQVDKWHDEGKTWDEVRALLRKELSWLNDLEWETHVAIAARVYNWKTGAELDGYLEIGEDVKTMYGTYADMMSEGLRAQLKQLADGKIAWYSEKVENNQKIITFTVKEIYVNQVVWGKGTKPFLNQYRLHW